MSDPTLQSQDGDPPEGLWPPAPTAEPSRPLQGFGTGDIRELKPQNGWLVLLLMVITAGYYSPFWMLRNVRAVNRLVPDRAIPIWNVWALVVFSFLNIVMAFMIEYIRSAAPSDVSGAHNTRLFTFVVGIFYLSMIFRFQGALNKILDRTSPNLRRFDPIGTFFFGALYLQICLNRRIKERTAEVVASQ